MKVNLQLFFKARKVRKMYYAYIRCCIKEKIQKPVIWVKAVWGVIKIHRDYPNKWERYVKFKEIEHKNEIEQQKLEKVKVYDNFLVEIVRFRISLITYCSYNEAVPEEKYDELYAEFDESKVNFRKYVAELEKMGVIVPNELKTMVESTKIDSFTDFDSYEEFRSKLQNILATIHVI